MKGQNKSSGQAQSSCSSDAPKKNRFYALCSSGKQLTSPNVVTNMLKVFFVDVDALLDLGYTLSFFYSSNS